MLRPNVKNYAESGNIRGLHYIFRDALDADPTFEDYLESYQYCENIPGFFEKHREMTPFAEKDSWQSSAYWNQLKMDLSENFSRERYEHLRKVAQVYYAEKIRTIRHEEAMEHELQKQAEILAQKKRTLAEGNCRTVQSENVQRKNNASPSAGAPVKAQGSSQKPDKQQEEDERIKRMKKELEKQNSDTESQWQKQKEDTAETKRRLDEENQKTLQAGDPWKGDSSSKKLVGVAIAVVIIILAVVLLLQGNPGKTAAIMTQPGMHGNVLWKMLLGIQNVQ